jgi:hypothetical protein
MAAEILFLLETLEKAPAAQAPISARTPDRNPA